MSLRLRNRWSYRGEGERGRERWNWQAFLGDDGTGDLARVTLVEYVLHPTFKNPRRTVTDPANGFEMKTNGWGTFMLRAFVTMNDGDRIKLEHYIVLERDPSTGVSE